MFKNLSNIQKECLYVVGIIASLVMVGFMVPPLLWLSMGCAVFSAGCLVTVGTVVGWSEVSTVKKEG